MAIAVWLAALAAVAGLAAWRLARLRAALHAERAARSAAEERVRARERFAAALLRHSSDLVSILDADGTIRFASPSHERILGWPPDELLGSDAFDLVHPDDRASLRNAFVAGLATPGFEATGEFRLRTRDGGWRVIEGQASGALDDPSIAGAVISGRDITARRRAEGDKAALLEVAQDIAGTLEPGELLHRVLQRTVAVVPCDGAVTASYDPRAAVFRATAHVGLRAPMADQVGDLVFPRGLGFGGRMAAGETVVLDELTQQADPFLQLLGLLGATAFVATPLAVRGRLIGAFVAFKRGGRFHPAQVQLMESIARQLAVAVAAAELYAAQREEAAVSATLARIGRELMSQLERPLLLDRLCRLTIDVLGCDVSRTYLLDAEEDTLSVVASAGDSAEAAEALRAVTLPRAIMLDYAGDLDRHDVLQVDVDRLGGAEGWLSSEPGRPRVLAMALRRGEALVGAHVARWHDRPEPCPPAIERIAGGLAQLASLALDNARLVAELDRADRVRSDFVASMSHELRTPLHVIIGYSDLLVDQMFGELSDEQRDTVRRIGEQGRELLELVNTTLDMSRLEAGRVAVALQDVDLVTLLAEIELEAQLVRRNPAVSIGWTVAPDVPALRTDAMKLKVVIKNLLLNALKYTDTGSVSVRVDRRDGGVEISVADTGIGIDAAQLPYIFDAFRQADDGSTRRGGVGLGLHIVRRLLDLLGGRIGVESERGRGSVFSIWLPLGEPAAATVAVAAG